MINNKTTELKNMIIEQAMRVQKMLINSIKIITESNMNKINTIFEIEKEVNENEIVIDDFCVSVLALYQPEAKHLRSILMAYKINNDLERIGDHLISIAKSQSWLNANQSLTVPPDILLMAEETQTMFDNCILAFRNEDVELSQKVLENDDKVDDLNVEIFRKLIIAGTKTKHELELNFNINNIAKNYERIADLATNIAEDTIYLVEGVICKHHFEG